MSPGPEMSPGRGRRHGSDVGRWHRVRYTSAVAGPWPGRADAITDSGHGTHKPPDAPNPDNGRSYRRIRAGQTHTKFCPNPDRSPMHRPEGTGASRRYGCISNGGAYRATVGDRDARGFPPRELPVIAARSEAARRHLRAIRFVARSKPASGLIGVPEADARVAWRREAMEAPGPSVAGAGSRHRRRGPKHGGPAAPGGEVAGANYRDARSWRPCRKRGADQVSAGSRSFTARDITSSSGAVASASFSA